MRGGEHGDQSTLLLELGARDETRMRGVFVCTCIILCEYLESCSHTFVSSDHVRQFVSLQKLLQSHRTAETVEMYTHMHTLTHTHSTHIQFIG